MKLLIHVVHNLALNQDVVPEEGRKDKDDLSDVVCRGVKELLIKTPSRTKVHIFRKYFLCGLRFWQNVDSCTCSSTPGVRIQALL